MDVLGVTEGAAASWVSTDGSDVCAERDTEEEGVEEEEEAGDLASTGEGVG